MCGYQSRLASSESTRSPLASGTLAVMIIRICHSHASPTLRALQLAPRCGKEQRESYDAEHSSDSPATVQDLRRGEPLRQGRGIAAVRRHPGTWFRVSASGILPEEGPGAIRRCGASEPAYEAPARGQRKRDEQSKIRSQVWCAGEVSRCVGVRKEARDEKRRRRKKMKRE
eukprot:3380822-Rhodomonas_salina.4